MCFCVSCLSVAVWVITLRDLKSTTDKYFSSDVLLEDLLSSGNLPSCPYPATTLYFS